MSMTYSDHVRTNFWPEDMKDFDKALFDKALQDHLDEEINRQHSKLAEQVEVIKDLRKHLKAVIEEAPKETCHKCIKPTLEYDHTKFCQAQHCLSYTSGYGEEK